MSAYQSAYDDYSRQLEKALEIFDASTKETLFLRDPKVQPPQAFAPNSPKSVEPSQKQP